MDGLEDARFVVGVHDADEERVGPQPLGDCLGLDVAAGGDRGELDVEAELLEAVERFKDGFVLDGRREDVLFAGALAMLGEAEEGDVVASVAPLVKKTSSGWTPASWATWRRAFSTASLARWP